MDFKNLTGLITEEHNLTSENKKLRRSLYIEFANTSSLQSLYSSLITAFKTYINENLISQNYDQDILYTLLKKNKCESTMGQMKEIDVKVNVKSCPLFPTINIARRLKRSSQVLGKMDEIGYQHLYMLTNMKDTSESESSNTNTSDSDLGSGDAAPIRKKLKTCQQAIEVDRETMLKYHHPNLTRICGTEVHVDVLIFINEKVCKQLSTYLGLIYLEDLLKEAEENDMDNVLYRLGNKNAKLFKLMQSYINSKLIQGCNNICLVHTSEIWENINANFRAVISNKNNELFYLESIKTTNVRVKLDQSPSILHYIQAVSCIIDHFLNFESHVMAKYQ